MVNNAEHVARMRKTRVRGGRYHTRWYDITTIHTLWCMVWYNTIPITPYRASDLSFARISMLKVRPNEVCKHGARAPGDHHSSDLRSALHRRFSAIQRLTPSSLPLDLHLAVPQHKRKPKTPTSRRSSLPRQTSLTFWKVASIIFL